MKLTKLNKTKQNETNQKKTKRKRKNNIKLIEDLNYIQKK